MHHLVNFNGKITSLQEVGLPLDHFVFNNASWVKEKFRLHKGNILLDEKHYFHLMASMRMMRIDIPMDFTPEFIYQQLLDLAKSLSLEHAILTFQAFPSIKGTMFIVQAESVKPSFINSKECIVEWYREHHFSNGFLSTLPTPEPAMHVLHTFATENSFDDLLITNVHKRIISTMKGAIFIIDGQNVQTPKLSEGVKNGVWRQAMIDIISKAPEFDTMTEDEISPFSIQKAQEVFIVQEAVGLQKISKFRKKTYDTNETEEIILPRFKEALSIN